MQLLRPDSVLSKQNMEFNSKEEVNEYIRKNQEAFDKYVSEQLLDLEKERKRAGYNDMSDQEKAHFDAEVVAYNEFVSKQYNIFNYPRKVD